MLRQRDWPTFFSKIQVTPGPLRTPCWLWTACIQHGYAIFQRPAPNRKKVYAHRWAWEQKHGYPPPDGYDLHHKCETKHCVNPDHVHPTLKKIHRQKHSHQLPNAQKTACKKGHPFSEENTYTWTDKFGITHRRCRICTRETWNRMYDRGSSTLPRNRRAMS